MSGRGCHERLVVLAWSTGWCVLGESNPSRSRLCGGSGDGRRLCVRGDTDALDRGAVSSSEASQTRNQSKRAKPFGLFSPRNVPRPICSGSVDVSTVKALMNSVHATPSSE